MKTIVKIEQEIDIKYVKIHIPVKYDDEDMPYDFPLRNGDCWDAVIDIDLGKIIDWPQGKLGKFHMKVCDEGSYYLLDADHKEIVRAEEDYVPNGLIPPKDGYSDYIHLIIEEDGTISNWYKNPSFINFFSED